MEVCERLPYPVRICVHVTNASLPLSLRRQTENGTPLLFFVIPKIVAELKLEKVLVEFESMKVLFLFF